MSKMSISVILFYKYVHVPSPDSERDAQRLVCDRLGLKGRLLIAEEGINGTLAGDSKDIDSYIEFMNNHPQFAGIQYKRDATDSVPFPRLRVKVRPEVVTLGVSPDLAHTAPKLSPKQFHDVVKDPNVVLLDARNNYESAIGKFKGATTLDIKNFKDLPRALDDIQDLKDKTVVTYCTGGIRCEKASALMVELGFKDVYQLDGGIIEYAKAYPEGQFEGECFVFDDRLKVGFTDTPKLLGQCKFCAEPTNSYQNCGNLACHELMLVCPDCATTSAMCSSACASHSEQRATVKA
jgi:UPF0176 protein